MLLRPFALAALLASAACTGHQAELSTPVAKPAATEFLAFGDHGYSLDYLDAEDYTPPRTEAEFLAEARAKWLKDKRPPAEFVAPPMDWFKGSAVAASGMMPVARAMEHWCTQVARCQFALMLGDNIYPDGATLGADGRDDAQRFQDIFVTPYGKFGWGNPDFRIYGVLGNHDWHISREAAMAQVRFLETTRPFYMDGTSYAVQAAPEVEIFALDTHILLGGEKVLDGKLADDGSEIPTTKLDPNEPWAVPSTPAERTMVADLEARLKASKARWKIVMGHHPLWSSAGGKFEQARTLRAVLLPTLCKYADLYFAGHEHTLELATDDCATAVPGANLPPMPNIVTGAASKQRPLNSAFVAHQKRNNPQLTPIYAKGMVWGFAHVKLEDDAAIVTMISTPNDASGSTKVETSHRFTRRTGR